MNKVISKVITIGLVFSSILYVSGCEDYKSNGDLRKEKIAQVIEYLDSRDQNKIKNLFSPNAITEIPNLDESITELFDYYKGVFVSDEWGGFIVNDSADYGKVTKDLDFSFDITTTEDVYRIAITSYRAKDTVNKNNIGLWQFFIIRYDDDPNPVYSYWGDWRKEPGLFIGTFHVREEPSEEVGELETYE